MKKSISLYPQITNKQLLQLNPEITLFEVHYYDGSERCELHADLQYEQRNGTALVKDDAGNWAPDKYGLTCTGKLVLQNSRVLFGEAGVVPWDAVLDIGLQWKSKSSNTRGAKKIASIKANTSLIEHDFEITFPAATMRLGVDLSFIVCVGYAGIHAEELECGMILGELASLRLELEGSGSTFTVFEKSAPGEPLWGIECDWDDPEYDLFSESVRVTINTAHNAWQAASDDEVRKEILKEIMATSMQIIIDGLEPYQYDISNEYEPGSVSAAVKYFISRAEIEDPGSKPVVAKDIRRYLDKAMK